jgi:flagella basal body P-ring formation protein FlgA
MPLYWSAVKLNQSLKKGDVIKASDVTSVQIQSLNPPNDSVETTEFLVGKHLKTAMKKGQLISFQDLDLQNLDEKLLSECEPVIFASSALPAGSVLTADKVNTIFVHKTADAGKCAKWSQISGKKLTHKVSKGQVFYLTFFEKGKATEQVPRGQVVYTSTDCLEGTLLAPDNVHTETLPEEKIPEDALDTSDQVEGWICKFAIARDGIVGKHELGAVSDLTMSNVYKQDP